VDTYAQTIVTIPVDHVNQDVSGDVLMVINVLTHVSNHALYAGNHVLGNAESDALMLIHVNKCAPKSVTDQSATPHVSIYLIVATSVLVYNARQNASQHVKYVITIN
jgi:hypothetical protein